MIQFANEPDADGGHTTAITQPIFDPTPGEAPPTATWSFVYDPVLHGLTSPDPVTQVTVAGRRLLQRIELPASPRIWFEFGYLEGGEVTDGLLRQRYLPRQENDPPGDFYDYTYTTHS